MNSDDSRSMSAFGANACMCAEYGFPVKHDARENVPLSLDSLKNAIERFASTHGFSYALAKSPARRKTIKWLQFTCTQCATRAAPLRTSSKRRRGAGGTDTDEEKSLPVHSVRIKYAFGDDPHTTLASYSLMGEQWTHCCGAMVPDTATDTQPPPAPVAPVAVAQPTQPAHILQNLIDSRIEHAIYVALVEPKSTPFTTGVGSTIHSIVTFICPLHVTSAARAALVTDTMQAMCDTPHTTRIADVRVTAERCRMLVCDEPSAARSVVDRLVIRVFL
jgi:hypothetical protein